MARLTLQILVLQGLCALLLLANCSARNLEDARVGSRKLLQSSTSSCKYDFSKLDYSNVTSVCKGPDYPVGQCCPAFSALACQYSPDINDFNSLCPLYFLAYLDVAGNYNAGVFVGTGRCNNGNNIC